jgi:hypothetical protein
MPSYGLGRLLRFLQANDAVIIIPWSVPHFPELIMPYIWTPLCCELLIASLNERTNEQTHRVRLTNNTRSWYINHYRPPCIK